MYRTCNYQVMIPTSTGGRYRFGWSTGFFLILAWIMAGCAATPVPDSIGPPSLAIWTLEDLSLPGTVQPELAELMTATVMETAETANVYPLVERERLLAILQELNLGSGDLADGATGLRIGRLVGARLMLFGAYQVVASQMRVDLRLVEVETGRILNTARKTVPAGNLSSWLEGAAAGTRELLSKR